MEKYAEEHALYLKAKQAAIEAARQKIAENPGQWYPCGFAGVKISPARGKFVKLLKELNVGYTDSFNGGYYVNDPAHLSTQWMDAKLAGARAFAKVLQESGIKAHAESMID